MSERHRIWPLIEQNLNIIIFDLLIIGQMKRSLSLLRNGWPRPVHWQETNLNFCDLWPLNYRSHEEVTMNTFHGRKWPTHWHGQFCCSRLLKFYHSLKQIWTFMTLTLYHRSVEEVTMNTFRWLTLTKHWLSQFCCWRLFKIWPF